MNSLLKFAAISLTYCYCNFSVASAYESDSQLLFENVDAENSIELSAHLGWESRYVSEGRDSLDGDSLIVGSFELGWKNLVAGVWYGYSPDQRFDELELSLTINHSIGDFDFYGGYIYVSTPFDGAIDNELAAGVAWSGLPLDIELAVDVAYSFNADGYFIEFSAGRDFSITDDLTLNFSVPFAINEDFVDDGHDGANNIAVQLGLEYALTDSVSIVAHSAYSWAIDSDSTLAGDDQLIDFFHAGVGIQWSF